MAICSRDKTYDCLRSRYTCAARGQHGASADITQFLARWIVPRARTRHPGPGSALRWGARGLAGRNACRTTNRRSGMAVRIRVADVEPGLFLRRTPQWNAPWMASTVLFVDATWARHTGAARIDART